MKRNLRQLSSRNLDVLVVGCGAHGAVVACHAAKAGYKVALLEKNDFCGATSANSLKILHGGLRYLQHLNIKRMRHSIVSRREMMRLAPHLIQPLPCLMPLYGYGFRGRPAMQAALFLNDCIGWDRNMGLAAEVCLPSGRTISKKKCQEIVSGVRDDGLQGAAVWYDALAVDTERLILAYLLEAAEYGALAANYAEVTGVALDGDGLYHVAFRDKFTRQVYTVKTRFVINAAGPWLENLLLAKKTSKNQPQRWALALNVVIRKQLFEKYAVALEGTRSYEDKDAIIKRGKRLYFFVPWRGYTMIGTNYRASTANPDCLSVQREDIQSMLQDINETYPAAQLEFSDVSFYHAGLLPMSNGSVERDENVQLEKNSLILEHDKSGFKGIFTIKGVKYTTAPHIATEIVRLLQQRFAPAGAAEKAWSVCNKELASSQDVKDLLYGRYGQRACLVGKYLHEINDDVWLDRTVGLLEAEIHYLIHEEMAFTLSDIVLRRTGLGTAECPARKILEKIALVMAEILGWDEDRQHHEIEEVLSRYSPLHPQSA